MIVAWTVFGPSGAQAYSNQAKLPDSEMDLPWDELDESSSPLSLDRPQDYGINLVGTVYPGKSSAVTAPFKGTIVSLHGSVLGSVVSEGDVIATLDSANVKREIKQAQISSREAEIKYLKLLTWNSSSNVLAAKRALDTARQDLASAKRATELTKQLLDDGIVAANELAQDQQAEKSRKSAVADAIDQYENVVDQGNSDLLGFAKQRFEVKNEELARLQDALSRSVIVAPQDGILLPANKFDHNLTVGQSVPEGEAILLIGSIDVIQIKTSVSEMDVNRLSLGQIVHINSAAFEQRTVTGIVKSISKYTSSFFQDSGGGGHIDPQAPRIAVVIEVHARELGIEEDTRMGMTVDISLEPPYGD